jgi:hypothetical protein
MALTHSSEGAADNGFEDEIIALKRGSGGAVDEAVRVDGACS